MRKEKWYALIRVYNGTEEVIQYYYNDRKYAKAMKKIAQTYDDTAKYKIVVTH